MVYVQPRSRLRLRLRLRPAGCEQPSRGLTAGVARKPVFWVSSRTSKQYRTDILHGVLGSRVYMDIYTWLQAASSTRYTRYLVYEYAINSITACCRRKIASYDALAPGMCTHGLTAGLPKTAVLRSSGANSTGIVNTYFDSTDILHGVLGLRA